ncbi:MAG: dihydrolipoyllysine-residue succinyltransferase [Gallionellaceae bacterium]|nr:dihydrolipoyllysine-residue succinyltransferase [Gallionellaceae bacterium]
MRIQVKAPELSESVQSGTLLEWRKKIGDTVARDEILVDLETDKVILEVPAPAAGILAAISVPDGGEIKAGSVLAEIETDAMAAAASAGGVVAAAAESAPAAAVPEPAVAEAGKMETVPHAPAATHYPPGRADRRVAMSRLRQRIAERMLEAQRTAAILTTFNEVDMQPVQDLRKRVQADFQKENGVKLGLMSFFVSASARALKQFPLVNASVDGRDIVYHDCYDIGVAVSSERGLVVPVLRDADRMSLAGIEKKIADFARRANSLELALDELEGGTFTISNGGVFGSMLSTPILNPPQSGVLGLHRIQDRPVALAGQVVIRPMMYVALSYDHRIVDGREAVSFLKTVKDLLEAPEGLLSGA